MFISSKCSIPYTVYEDIFWHKTLGASVGQISIVTLFSSKNSIGSISLHGRFLDIGEGFLIREIEAILPFFGWNLIAFYSSNTVGLVLLYEYKNNDNNNFQ